MVSKLAKGHEEVLADFEFVLVSQDIAVMAARLRAGTGLHLPDALQAATALEIGAVALLRTIAIFRGSLGSA
jgi:predicted nucleic acid-binding protein